MIDQTKPKIFIRSKKGSGLIQMAAHEIKSRSNCDVQFAVFPDKNSRLYLGDGLEESAPIFLPMGGAISGEFLVDGKYQSTSSNIIEQILRHYEGNFVFVDVGANIGLVSRQIIKFSPKSLFCYEPRELAFSFLKKNIPQKIYNLNLFNGVLWKSDSDETLYDTRDIDGYGSLNPKHFEKSTQNIKEKLQIKVKSYNIEKEYDKWSESTAPIFYKSDIEGFDVDLISSLMKQKTANIECIMLEISQIEYDYFFETFLDILTMNYQIVAVAPSDKIFKITNKSKKNKLEEKNWKFIDIIAWKKFNKSKWYKNLETL